MPGRLILLLACLGCVNSYADSPRPLTPDRFNYMMQCQGCHKADGAGIDNEVPDLRTHGSALLATTEGRRFFVSVPGSANSPLTDAELAGVLNYIIMDIIGDAELELFSEKEVTNYRSTHINDVAALRARLVATVSAGSAGAE